LHPYTLVEGTLVELRNVAVSYPGHSGERLEVAGDLSLTLGKGEMAYLIGPTGSGKSTLLKLLYMDIKPDFGFVRVGHYQSDRIADKDIPFLRRSLGVVFQDFQLLPDRSAFDNIAFALYATGKRGRVVKERVMQALTRVGLSHRAHAKPHEMSGGEQQRACIARAIVNEPVLLLADEPTGNLDPELTIEIMDLIIDSATRGTTVIVATHDMRLVERYGKRVVRLEGGRVAEDAPASGRAA